jgi:hypothetical protein
MTSPTFSMTQSISERHEQQSIDLKKIKIVIQMAPQSKRHKKAFVVID